MVNITLVLKKKLLFGRIILCGKVLIMDKTSIFNVAALRQEMILLTVNEVIESLEKKGYKAENQLVGYLLTGDVSYISNFEGARDKMRNLKREEVLLALINSYEGK